MTTREKTFLYHGLPCVLHRNNYIIFSPFSQKIAILKKKEIKNPKIRENLQSFGFFGKPFKSTYEKDVIRLMLITTTDCNLRCIYCFAEGGERKNYMDPDIGIKAIQQFAEGKSKKIYLSFFGGEPSLNFECIKNCVEYANNLEIPVKYQITTNGVMHKKVLDFLVKNNFIFFLSIDGTPKIHNFHRPLPGGRPSFPLVLKTIKYLIRKNSSVKFRATITKFNVNFMDKIVKYIYSLGGKHVHFEPIHLAGRAFQQKKFQPSPELFVKNLKKALNAAKKLDMKIIHTSYLYLMQPCINFCSSLQGRRITITPNGDLTLCLETQDEFHPFYNFLKIGEFDKLTNRFKFDWKKIRLFKRHSVENIKNCRNCFAKYICAGGCLVRNLIENESYKQPNNYFCKIRKSVLSDLILRMWKESQI